MDEPNVFIPDRVLDDLALASLKWHYEVHKGKENPEIADALKRIIRYYGGTVS